MTIVARQQVRVVTADAYFGLPLAGVPAVPMTMTMTKRWTAESLSGTSIPNIVVVDDPATPITLAPSA
jgi:hypothetical protein